MNAPLLSKKPSILQSGFDQKLTEAFDDFAGGMSEAARSGGGKSSGASNDGIGSDGMSSAAAVQKTANTNMAANTNANGRQSADANPDMAGDIANNADAESQLQNLLKMLDSRLIADMEFEESWIESLPDGLYSYRGRRGGARAVMAVQLLMLLHQQQISNQQTVQFAQAQLQRQLQQIAAQFQQIARMPDAAQKTAIAQILNQPQNAAAMIAVKQQLQTAPQLQGAVSFSQLAAVAATIMVVQSQPALAQFLNDAATRLAKGQLSPVAERNVQKVMEIAARVLNVQTAPAIPATAPSSNAPTIRSQIPPQRNFSPNFTANGKPELLSGIRQVLARMTGTQTTNPALPPQTAKPANQTAVNIPNQSPQSPPRTPILTGASPGIQTSLVNLSAVRTALSSPPIESKIPPSVQTIYKTAVAGIDRAIIPPMLNAQSAREIPIPANNQANNFAPAAPVFSPAAQMQTITAHKTASVAAPPASSIAPIANSPINSNINSTINSLAQPIATQQSPQSPPISAQPAANEPPVKTAATPAPSASHQITSDQSTPPVSTAPKQDPVKIDQPKIESVIKEPDKIQKPDPVAEPKTQNTPSPDTKPQTVPNEPQPAPQTAVQPAALPQSPPAQIIQTKGFDFAATANLANANAGVTTDTVADCCKGGENNANATATPANGALQQSTAANEQPGASTQTNPLAKFRQSKQRNN